MTVYVVRRTCVEGKEGGEGEMCVCVCVCVCVCAMDVSSVHGCVSVCVWGRGYQYVSR